MTICPNFCADKHFQRKAAVRPSETSRNLDRFVDDFQGCSLDTCKQLPPSVSYKSTTAF